jgi:DNA-binding IclR family transcriptional regulator
MNSQEKVIQVIKILSKPPFEYGVTELGNKIGCGKSGMFKLLEILVESGFARRNSNRKYTLGLSLYLIGKAFEEHIGITHYAKPYMEKLRDEVNENVNLGMMVEGKPTIVCRAESLQVVRITGSIGATRPFYASAIGKTLAAYEDENIIREWINKKEIKALTPNTKTSPEEIITELANVRKQGYAISDEEFVLEAFGIGAPIRDSNVKVWAAISIGAPKIRITKEKIEKYTLLLIETAKKISHELSI